MASYLSISITQNSQNVASNTSNVTVKVSIYSEASWNYDDPAGYCTINGTRYDFTHDFYKGQTTEIFSKTLDIPHNADGAKTLSVYASYSTQVSLGTLTQSASKTLTTIPRTSVPTLSASSFNAGSALTIYTNRASSSFTHTLTYTLNGSSGTIATGVGASFTWTAANTKALASLIPNSTSGTITIYCYTYNGGTHIGTKSITATISVPNTADFKPAISGVSVVDANNYANKYSGFVQGKSTPKVTISATANYSSIKSYKVTFQGIAVTTTSNVASLAAINQTGSLNIVVTVTDGRGRTASKTETITALAYNSPTVSARVVRCNSDGTDNDEGTHMKVSCSASIVALNNANSKNIKLQYKKKSTTNWTTHKTWTSYTVNEDVVISASTDSSYDIQLVASDDFTLDKPATYITELGTVAVTIDYHESGKGIAIGKVSEGEGFEVDWAATFNKAVTLKENFKFDSGSKVSTPIYIWDGDENGSGIAIGAGGTVVIGGGESAKNFATNMSLVGTEEQTYITADGSIYFYTNCNTVADKKHAMALDTNGNIVMQGVTHMQNNKGLYMRDKGGTYRDLFRINDQDIFAIGYGMYSASVGTTNIYAGSNMHFYARGDIFMHSNLYFYNNVNIYHYDKSGAARRTLIYDNNNDCILGFDNRELKDGRTFVDGNLVYLRSNGAVYANSATIATSDAREKENIVPLGASPVATYGMRSRSVEQVDIHSELFDRLKPVQFNYINREDARTCFGLVAQDVLETILELGFGEDELDLVHSNACGSGDSTDRLGISYQNFTALLIHEVQKLKAKVATLEEGN